MRKRLARAGGCAIIALLALSPRARAILLAAFRRFAAFLATRSSPPVRKNFLEEASQKEHSARNLPRNEKSHGPKATVPTGDFQRFSDIEHVMPAWLSEGLRRGPFEFMKPIQRKVLPLALQGRDVVGIAPTGSGKTLAFLVPALVHAAGQPSVLRPADGPVALVLAPTRELAVQIGAVAEGLMRPSHGDRRSPQRGFNHAVIYGGPRRTDQLSTLRMQQSTHLVVATPGRLLDFVSNGAFGLRHVSFFVLDEGDRMLDFGFEPDVTQISNQIRQDRQMLFFSATWPAEVEQAAGRLCTKGTKGFQCVLAAPEEAGLEDPAARKLELPGHSGITLPPAEIEQVVEVVPSMGDWNYSAGMRRKMPILRRHLEEALGNNSTGTAGKALIFVSTRMAAEELGIEVARWFGLSRCGIMHGQRKQDQREATLRSFRDGHLRALVCTDVLGRGVDIPGVTHVVVFDFPNDIETYVHRVGRTGRNGKRGKAVALFEPVPWYPDQANELAEVLRGCGQRVPDALLHEERKHNFGTWDDDSGLEPLWAVPAEGHAQAPAVDEAKCPLASADELGLWHCGGARTWGYSANGGLSEQVRLELRADGVLRTTCGMGTWELLEASPAAADAPAGPHCPPPSRPAPAADAEGIPPPPTRAPPSVDEALLPPMPTRPCPEDAGKPSGPEAPAGAAAAAPVPPPPPRQVWDLALSWAGCTDIVRLDDKETGFELVSRNGRPASSFRKRTVGHVLPGVAL